MVRGSRDCSDSGNPAGEVHLLDASIEKDAILSAKTGEESLHVKKSEKGKSALH